MIHFLYLLGFALFVGIIFAALSSGDIKERLFYGAKVFAQFLGVSLLIAWIFYFIPW